MQHRRIRLLREKHGITACELSRYSGFSQQRLVRIELEMQPITPRVEQTLVSAFSRLIADRRENLTALESDFQAYRKSLLDIVDEEEPE